MIVEVKYKPRYWRLNLSFQSIPLIVYDFNKFRTKRLRSKRSYTPLSSSAVIITDCLREELGPFIRIDQKRNLLKDLWFQPDLTAKLAALMPFVYDFIQL